MENYKNNARKFNIVLEGVTVGTDVGLLARGAWEVYTYEVTVSDGALTLLLDKVGSDTHLMGVCII